MKIHMLLSTLFLSLVVVMVHARESAGSLTSVAYRSKEMLTKAALFDIGEVVFQFTNKPPVPKVSVNQANGEVIETFFFPMINASDALCRGKENKVVEEPEDRSYRVEITCPTGQESGVQVAFRYKQDRVRVVCHIGRGKFDKSAVFRLHDRLKLQQAQEFTALRMVSGLKIMQRYILS